MSTVRDLARLDAALAHPVDTDETSHTSGLLLPESFEQGARLTLDGLTALGLLVIAVRYASFWLGGAMLLYAAQFSLHAFYMVTARPVDLLHIKINNMNFLGISACLALGTIVGWRQRIKARKAAA